MRVVLIVSSCLCLTIGVIPAQQRPTSFPDEIFFNGKIVTVDPSFSIQQAFAVTGDTIVAVGKDAAVRALAGPKTRRTNLRNHTVIPGLIDNHTHGYIAALDASRGVNLVGVTSLAEMLDRIKQGVAKAKPGETVVTTWGWDPARFPEKRGPTRQDLDRVSADHPVVVIGGRAAAYFNSAALKAAGISRETQTVGADPVRKDEAGEPTGFFSSLSGVTAATEKIVPLPSEAELKQMFVQLHARLNAWGFTGIREVQLMPHAMRAYWSLSRERKLTIRTALEMSLVAADSDRIEEILKPWGVGAGFGDNWLRLDSLGEFGVDLGGNSYSREPYADQPETRGGMRVTPEQLARVMRTISRSGWRPAVHILGDASLDAVLDAYEAVDAESPIRGKRWIVEHIPLAHPDQMERMARLGLVVVTQPEFYEKTSDLIRRYGKDRAERVGPIRELLDHHLIVTAGSDWGGNFENNPFAHLHFYITRKTEEGIAAAPAQKISREEALRLATINNAYMTFEEEVKGSLESGKLADFVILSDDIMTIPEDEIPAIRALATYVGGRKVFSRKESGF